MKVRTYESGVRDQVEFDATPFGGKVLFRTLKQAVHMYQANLRQGTVSTRGRDQVAGSNKKPWKQKHTGRARAGSTRSPLWRGGGVIFGPHPRPMGSRLPQQIRRRALIESLKGKIRDGELRVIDGLRADAPKTKPFAGLAGTFEVARSSIIVLAGPAPALVKSLRNLARFRLCDAGSLNALDVVNADKVLVAREAFASLDRRAKESDASGD